MNSVLFSFLFSRLFLIMGHALLVVTLGQYIFERTHSPTQLGLLGLFLFLPKFFFSLHVGHYVDTYDRKIVLLFSRVFQVVSFVILALCVVYNFSLIWIYFSLSLLGFFLCFDAPAQSALLPSIVSIRDLRRAITYTGTIVQVGLFTGPLLFSFICQWGTNYFILMGVGLVIRLTTLLITLQIKTTRQSVQKEKNTLPILKSVGEGLTFLWRQKILFGAISLDLFAVLFGGAVGMLPFFANEILKVGPTGLGILRAMPYIGSVCTGIFLSRMPIQRMFGKKYLTCVFIFGLATIAFALSQNFYLSLFCLCIIGASDMVGVVIRSILVQELTPDAMRGRINSVNHVFIGASNELGEVESGLVAGIMGVVPSVAFGGMMTLLVVMIWKKIFVELKELDKIPTQS